MRTFHVSTTGSDITGDGSAANPWRTINHAAHQNVGAGDVILVAPGTYTEQVWMWRGGGPEGQLTLRSAVPGEALIRPPEGAYSTLNIRAHHITVEGFDIVGGDGHGIDAESVAYTQILDNRVHSSGGSGIQFNFSEFILIEGNMTFENAGTNGWQTSGISVYQNRNITGDTTTPGFRTIIRDNISFNNVTGPEVTADHTDGNGIIIDDFQSTQTAGFPNYTFPTLVENNLTFGNGGKGIQVTWSDFVTVRGNTAAFNNTDPLNSGTWRGELSNAQSSNNTWEDNIAVTDRALNPFNTAIGDYSYGGYVNVGTVWRGNVTFNGTPGDASLRLDGGNTGPLASNGNLLGVDPQFVDALSFHFGLRSTSPALGRGFDAGAAMFAWPATTGDSAAPDEGEAAGDTPGASAPPPAPPPTPPAQTPPPAPAAETPPPAPPAETPPTAPAEVAPPPPAPPSQPPAPPPPPQPVAPETPAPDAPTAPAAPPESAAPAPQPDPDFPLPLLPPSETAEPDGGPAEEGGAASASDGDGSNWAELAGLLVAGSLAALLLFG